MDKRKESSEHHRKVGNNKNGRRENWHWPKQKKRKKDKMK